MNKRIKGLVGILTGFMLMGTVAMADSPAAVMETFTGDSTISVYVKGVENAAETSVQIATTEVDNVDVQMVSELERPMQTLVMIDNSLSISEENRDKTLDFLQNLIADRLSGEEICIAVFGEDITKLTDFTNDYGILKRAVENISYGQQNTYLTDVLYDLLTGEYQNNEEDVYRRIVVISDGFDNKSIGYTKDELYSLLKDVRIPIYTIGCLDETNQEGLENMFSLSRMTSAGEFLLDDTGDTWDIAEEMRQDRNIVKLIITPPENLLDGTKKMLKIEIADDVSLTTELTMPQQAYEESKEEPEMEETGVEEAETKPKTTFPILPIVGLAVATVIAATVILVLKKNKGKPDSVETTEMILDNIPQDNDDKTEIIGALQETGNEDSTVLIWQQEAKYQVILTDINSPTKSFQTPLNQSLVIGRKKGECDVVFDYDKSVSGKHCEISVRNGKFYLKDLQASNGTYLNGNRVLTETEIVSGNILKLGRLELRFEVR